MVFGKQLCIYKDERDTLMVAMVGILRGQGFISWGSNPKYNFLWLFTFFFYVNVEVGSTKIPWCEQRARWGGKDGIDIDNRPRQQDLSKFLLRPFYVFFSSFLCLFMILTTALCNKTCQTDLIFVTIITNNICGEKMWRNFIFPCMTMKMRISPHVENFQ